MPAADSPPVLVARFLKSNNYNDTLDAFLREAGLPPDAGQVSKGDLTLERVLEEKKLYDLSANFEKLGNETAGKGWTTRAPSWPSLIGTLPNPSNLLSVTVANLHLPESQRPRPYLFTTSADRRFSVLSTSLGFTLESSSSTLHDSPILSMALLSDHLLLSTSMSGQLTLSQKDGHPVARRRDHTKYAVKVVVYHEDGSQPETSRTWVATAGWDMRVYVYLLRSSTGDSPLGDIPAPYASLSLPSNPESILFLPPPSDPTGLTTPANIPILLLSRRDSSHLHYYSLPVPQTDQPESNEPTTLTLLGTQNLAPNSNAWIAFTPTSLALSPTYPNILAVATSTTPHMKLLIVRLLIPSALLSAPPPPPRTQASQARAAQAITDTEAAAIMFHVNTLAPQTPYSTPVVVWRPDGSGVWVNGDDGVIRGVDGASGKVVLTLGGRDGKEGHEAGSKIRCLWGGVVERLEGDGGVVSEEWLVSGGFDRRLIVWRAEEGAGGA